MMLDAPAVIPVELFPGDYCVVCVDPDHGTNVCYHLEMRERRNGDILIGRCGCENSVTPDAPGRYVIRVTQVQKE